MAAWLMAVWIRGMTPAETFALTDAMVGAARPSTFERDRRDQGRQALDGRCRRQGDDRRRACPVAACGVTVPKISGRGARPHGRDAGQARVDPWLPVDLDHGPLRRAGAGDRDRGRGADRRRWCPADKAIYALRDVTATVDLVPLIASSIMSQEDRRRRGRDRSRRQVRARRVHARAARPRNGWRWRWSRLARTPGGRHRGAADGHGSAARPCRRQRARGARGVADGQWRGAGGSVRELVVDPAARLVALADPAWTRRRAAAASEQAVADGSAAAVYDRWIRAQGGDPDAAKLPRAPVVREVYRGPG